MSCKYFNYAEIRLLGCVSAAPWGFHDREVETRVDDEFIDVLIDRMLERLMQLSNEGPVRTDPIDFRQRLKRNYARPAIRMG